MKKYTMRPLTETSWILSANGDRIGIVSQVNEEICVLGNFTKKSFKSLDEFKEYLGHVTIEEPPELKPEPTVGEINGYPVKHPVWHNVETKEMLHSYTRTTNSNTRYVAGYFGINFPNGWTQSFGPKLTTLENNEYIGPFTTQLELRNAVSQKNNKFNV